jgi:hypothetical protein
MPGSEADLTTCLGSIFDAKSEKNIFRNSEKARTEIRRFSKNTTIFT